jgi:hypothetical protein
MKPAPCLADISFLADAALKDPYETLGVERSASPDAITVSLKFNRLFAETKGSCTQGPHFGAVRAKPRNPTSGPLVNAQS